MAETTPDRDRFVAAILSSNSRKKLVVGGPGTGKTYLFEEYLKAKGANSERSLILTFIRNLVGDLEKTLSAHAKVQTFHAYGKSLLYKLPVGGITLKFDYYPALVELVSADIALLRGGRRQDIQTGLESDIWLLRDSEVLRDFFRFANYYDAVGHEDAVLRVVRYLTKHPEFDFRLDQLIVDEVQDFNALEMTLIERIAARTPILAAGDDDQALYDFKHSNPNYIRGMQSKGYTVFPLPYCSRCPEVVVAAANDVIQHATQMGKLIGRIPKPYLCHEPSKRADSEAHPKIIAAYCSTSTPAAPYMAKYVLGQIDAISSADIVESGRVGYPTALVIGRTHIISEVYEVIRQRYGDNVTYPKSPKIRVSLVDGYELINKRSSSRLGWRILLHLDPCEGKDAFILRAVREEEPLDNLLPASYKEKHRRIVALMARLENNEPLTESEASALQNAVGMDMRALQRRMGLINEEIGPEPDAQKPRIIVTTFLGAKGLSAGHVFVVGLLDGELPTRRDQITDDEICQFVVALTRTRKQCHLVTTTRHRGKPSHPSILLSWIASARLHRLDVDKQYFKRGR